MSNRGRNTELIEARNRALVKRFYWWSEIKRRRYDDVLKILSTQEFFITEQTVYRILQANSHLLDELMKNTIDENKKNIDFTVFKDDNL